MKKIMELLNGYLGTQNLAGMNIFEVDETLIFSILLCFVFNNYYTGANLEFSLILQLEDQMPAVLSWNFVQMLFQSLQRTSVVCVLGKKDLGKYSAVPNYS